MPRNASGQYTLPSGTEAVSDELISSAKYNSVNNDLEADLNDPRPIVAGGTGADNAADARTNLGLVVGTDVAAQSDIDALDEWVRDTGAVYADTGTGDDFEIAAPITAYESGQIFHVRMTRAPTGASTLDVNGLGPIAIQRVNANGNIVDITAGIWDLGDIVTVVHDGTRFLLLSPIAHTDARWLDGTQEDAGVISPRKLITTARAVASAPAAILEDHKASGTNGGNALDGSWFILALNTQVRNEGGLVTLAVNEFTPAVDGYVEWWTQGFACGNFQSRLYSATTTSVVGYGTNAHTSNANPAAVGISTGRATVIGGRTYRLEMQVSVSKSGDGLGLACNFGNPEVYRSVSFWPTE